MIYTLTLNPSIDYVIELDRLIPGEIMRTYKENIIYGGKGINVSHMLKELGMNSIALGFVSGFSGDALLKGVEEYGITPDFIKVDNGFTRINVKIKSNIESEINGQGPIISTEHINQLFKKIANLKDGDILVLSGNASNTMNDNIYADIMDLVNDKKINIIIDTTKNALVKTLSKHPFLIKPNHKEISEFFHIDINTEEELIFYGKELQKLGAKNVLISRAEKGAILLCEDGLIYKEDAIKGKVVNSVGSGDSMVAGFIYGYEKWKDYKKALILGVVCGGASAFSKGIAKYNQIEQYLSKYDIIL